MTTTQVVKTSVTVNNNSPIKDYVHPDDQTQPAFEMFLSLLQLLHVYYLGKNSMTSLSEVDKAFHWQLALIERTQLERVMSHKTQWSGKVVLTWQ